MFSQSDAQQNNSEKTAFDFDDEKAAILSSINTKLAKVEVLASPLQLKILKKHPPLAELTAEFKSCNEIIDEDNKQNNDNNKHWYKQIFNNKLLTDKEKAACEEYKLFLLQLFLNYLESNSTNKNLKSQKNDHQAENKPETITEKLKRYVKFFLFTVFGLSMMLVYSLDDFPGIENLITSIIPGVTNPALLIGALIIIGINLILLCSFELSLLQKLFGISVIRSPLKEAFVAQKNQLKVAKKINEAIENKLITLPEDKRSDVAAFVCTMNKDILNKKPKSLENTADKNTADASQQYHEHPFMKGLRIGVTAFGLLMTATGGYFIAPMILAILLPASLAGGPVGLGITVLIIATMVVGTLAFQGQGMWNLFNPASKSHTELQKKINKFDCKGYDESKTILDTLAPNPAGTSNNVIEQTLDQKNVVDEPENVVAKPEQKTTVVNTPTKSAEPSSCSLSFFPPYEDQTQSEKEEKSPIFCP